MFFNSLGTESVCERSFKTLPMKSSSRLNKPYFIFRGLYRLKYFKCYRRCYTQFCFWRLLSSVDLVMFKAEIKKMPALFSALRLYDRFNNMLQLCKESRKILLQVNNLLLSTHYFCCLCFHQRRISC